MQCPQWKESVTEFQNSEAFGNGHYQILGGGMFDPTVVAHFFPTLKYPKKQWLPMGAVSMYLKLAPISYVKILETWFWVISFSVYLNVYPVFFQKQNEPVRSVFRSMAFAAIGNTKNLNATFNLESMSLLDNERGNKLFSREIVHDFNKWVILEGAENSRPVSRQAAVSSAEESLG